MNKKDNLQGIRAAMACNIPEDAKSFELSGRLQWQLAFTIINSIINIASTVLNVMTIIVYRIHKQLETKSNIIIASMAIAGIILAASELLTTLGARTLSRWHLTEAWSAWCVAQNYIEAVLDYFILHAIALTSIQRQVIISKILRPVLHKKLWKMKAMLLTIVLYIIGVCLPMSIVFKGKWLNMTAFHGCKYSCKRNNVASFYYELVQTFLLFVVPSLIILGNYAFIHHQIRKKSRASRRKLRRASFLPKQKNRKTDMQTTLNITVILLVLAVFCFPKEILILVTLFKATKLNSSSLFIVVILSNIFQQFASFIHVLTNTKFRAKFINTFSTKKEKTMIWTPGSSMIGRKRLVQLPYSFSGHQASRDYELRTRSFSFHNSPYRRCNTKSITILTTNNSSNVQLSQLESKITIIGDYSQERQNTQDVNVLTLKVPTTQPILNASSESDDMKLLPKPPVKNVLDVKEMLTPAAMNSASEGVKMLPKSSTKQASDKKPATSAENGAMRKKKMHPSPSAKQAPPDMKTSTPSSVHAASHGNKLLCKSSAEQALDKEPVFSTANGATRDAKVLKSPSEKQAPDGIKISTPYSVHATSEEMKMLPKSSTKQASDKEPALSAENGDTSDVKVVHSPSKEQAFADMKIFAPSLVHATSEETKTLPKSFTKQAPGDMEKFTDPSRSDTNSNVKMLHSPLFRLSSDVTKISIALSMNIRSGDVKVFPVTSTNYKDITESSEMTVAVVNLAPKQTEQPEFV